MKMLQDRKVSGERAGSVIYTDNPVRDAAEWRRDSPGSLDSVFFHFVTRHCLQLRGRSSVPSRAPACSRGRVVAAGRKLRVPVG